MPSPRSRSGQAAVEYIALLALLAVVLAGAGVAVAAPELPKEVVHQVRVALCIVGGDVCRQADAVAAGLEPCVTEDGVSETADAVTVGLLRLGGRAGWSVERRSDGRLLLTQREGIEGGVSAGVGARLGPIADVHANGTGGVGFAHGRMWLLPDRAALEEVARAFVRNPPHPERALRAPDYTFLEGGRVVAGEAGGGVAGAAVGTVVTGQARDAIGRRVGPEGSTWYYDVGGDISTVLPSLGAAGRMIFEYTDGSPPILAVRATHPGGRAVITEVLGRQVLADPADAARVRRFLAAAVPLTGPALIEARAILGRLREAGTLQRFTYAVESDSHGGAYGGGAGVQVTVERAGSTTRRRLVDAVVLGDRPARRADCLGI